MNRGAQFPRPAGVLFDEYARAACNLGFRLTADWAAAGEVVSLTFLQSLAEARQNRGRRRVAAAVAAGHRGECVPQPGQSSPPPRCTDSPRSCRTAVAGLVSIDLRRRYLRPRRQRASSPRNCPRPFSLETGGFRCGGGPGSEVVSATADRVTHHAEQRQNRPDHHYDDADRPDNRDLRDEPDDKQNNAENDHVQLPVIEVNVGWPRRR